jgi:hypothetical protein
VVRKAGGSSDARSNGTFRRDKGEKTDRLNEPGSILECGMHRLAVRNAY